MRRPENVRERLSELRDDLDDGVGNDRVQNRLEAYCDALEWVLEESDDSPIELSDREDVVFGEVVDRFLLDEEMSEYMDAVCLAGKVSGQLKYDMAESEEKGRYILVRQSIQEVYDHKDLY